MLLQRFDQYILRTSSVIETHTKNVRFCILCNYVNKITPAIQSRCTRFRFSPLPEKEVQRKVDEVVQKEGYASHDNHSISSLQVDEGGICADLIFLD